MATTVQPGFMGPNGAPQPNQGAGWAPRAGDPGMPANQQVPPNPFTGQQPGQQPGQHPWSQMQQGGFMGAPPPVQGGQMPFPGPFGTQSHASPDNPGGGQLPGQIPSRPPQGWQPPSPQQQPGQQPQGGMWPSQQQPGQQAPPSPWGQYPLPGGQPPIQQQQAQPQGGDPASTILPAHPGIPQELQGRSLAEAIGLYNGMRQVVLRYANGQPAPQPVAPQPSPVQHQQQPAPGQQGAPPQGADFWRNPVDNISRLIEERVGQVLDQRIAPMLAPVTMQANMSAIDQARGMVAREIPGFAQLEPEILTRLQGADPRALANPELWRIVAKTVMADAMLGGRFQIPRGSGPYPPQAPPAGQNPLPNLNGFFSEAPGMGPQNFAGAPQLTEQQRFVAQQMGMPDEVYLAWSGGTQRQPQMGGRR